MKFTLFFVTGLALAACGPKAGISDVRMIHAPPREPNCQLEMIQIDPTTITVEQRWEILGYVTFSDAGTQDPFAKANRELLRPRACAMGGTAVGIAVNASAQNAVGAQGSAISYMVLRPKSLPSEPEAL
ncbi:MAG: hypothetical protein IPH44_22750 [Myxococcales bacterium]|jgi:hypothetical protein|nr:hypothetical protein [Myxococcales bacterium]MBK7192184.1 hypothetical protein [Myxococcales bacterium]MBP6845736.1 hypothetical protein [Kofleriaceae bacterium]